MSRAQKQLVLHSRGCTREAVILLNIALNWVNEPRNATSIHWPMTWLYQQDITAIELTRGQAGSRAPGMRASIAYLLQLFFRRRLLLARFSFFFSFVSFAWPNRKRELAWGTRLLSDREAIDRASARWLPPKGRSNVRTWRDRTSIFHRARLRITCPCAPHTNRPFASLFPFLFLSTSRMSGTIGKLYTVWRVDITEHIQFLSLVGAQRK